MEHISDRATSYAQESTTRKPIQEPNDQHASDVVCQRARNEPDEVHPEGTEVYDAAAIELG